MLRIADARHPTLAGTYLAACTFFAALFNQSPEGLEYSAGLDSKDAAYLQSVAWQTVLSYRARSVMITWQTLTRFVSSGGDKPLI